MTLYINLLKINKLIPKKNLKIVDNEDAEKKDFGKRFDMEII
jgi:hypothetical protein